MLCWPWNLSTVPSWAFRTGSEMRTGAPPRPSEAPSGRCTSSRSRSSRQDTPAGAWVGRGSRRARPPVGFGQNGVGGRTPARGRPRTERRGRSPHWPGRTRRPPPLVGRQGSDTSNCTVRPGLACTCPAGQLRVGAPSLTSREKKTAAGWCCGSGRGPSRRALVMVDEDDPLLLVPRSSR